MRRISICLLGPFEVRVDGEVVTRFEYAKVRALLAYLAMESSQPQLRTNLAALLWPEQSDRMARGNLSHTLNILRNSLGDKDSEHPILLADVESIQIDPRIAVELDVEQFLALLHTAEAHAHQSWRTCSACAGRLRQAMALYRGNFLSGFFIPDSSPFEEWAGLHREHLLQRGLSALQHLAAWEQWRGEYAAAIEFTRRQIALEPLLEENHRALMKLLALSDQKAAALTQYAFLRRTLLSELDVEPEAETTALYQTIRLGDPQGTLKDPRQPPSRLPAPPTGFTGRAGDLDTVKEIWGGGARLATVTGAPGVGKTRLALEVARQLHYDFEDGACFVELGPVAEAAQVPSAVAQALGIKEQPGRSLEKTIQAYLQTRHILLVLDNFEHVMGAAPFVAGLLAAGPGLKLLVTSRTCLHLRGEKQYLLAPLPEDEAVQLFVERAQAVSSSFQLTVETQDSIASLCRKIDYLPLGIELFAVRARMYSPAELLQQLERHLDTNGGIAPDLPDRQSSLRNAIAWSYIRLSEDERRLLAFLGVFTGGFTVEAAQAVAGTFVAGLHQPVPVLLEKLVESSLVQAWTSPGDTRFTLLETIREFALEQLATQGDTEIARQCHAAYFLTLAELAQPELFGPNQKAWFDRLSRELSNLRSALSWSQTQAIEINARLAIALGEFWIVRGGPAEGLAWLKSAVQFGKRLPELLFGRTLLMTGRLAWKQGDLKEAQALLTESQQIFRQTSDHGDLAFNLYNLGIAHSRQADYAAAMAHFNEGLMISQQEGDQFVEAACLNGLAEIAMCQGNLDLDRTYTEQSLALHQALHDPRNSARMTHNLGITAIQLGDYEAARRYSTAALATARELEDSDLITTCLFGLGKALEGLGQLAEASETFEEAIRIHRACGNTGAALAAPVSSLGRVQYLSGNLSAARRLTFEALRLRSESHDRQGIAYTLETLAMVAYREGNPARAARLLGAAASIRNTIGSLLSPAARVDTDRLAVGLRLDLGEQGFDEAWEEGRLLTEEQAIALALKADR